MRWTNVALFPRQCCKIGGRPPDKRDGSMPMRASFFYFGSSTIKKFAQPVNVFLYFQSRPLEFLFFIFYFYLFGSKISFVKCFPFFVLVCK